MVRIVVSLLVVLCCITAAQAQLTVIARDNNGGLYERSVMTLDEQDRTRVASNKAASQKRLKALTREWTSADGKFKVTAAFSCAKGDKVWLIKNVEKNLLVKQKTIEVLLTRLCEADRKFVAAELHKAKITAKHKAMTGRR